jgi:hypothetical protein
VTQGEQGDDWVVGGSSNVAQIDASMLEVLNIDASLQQKQTSFVATKIY